MKLVASWYSIGAVLALNFKGQLVDGSGECDVSEFLFLACFHGHALNKFREISQVKVAKCKLPLHQLIVFIQHDVLFSLANADLVAVLDPLLKPLVA